MTPNLALNRCRFTLYFAPSILFVLMTAFSYPSYANTTCDVIISDKNIEFRDTLFEELVSCVTEAHINSLQSRKIISDRISFILENTDETNDDFILILTYHTKFLALLEDHKKIIITLKKDERYKLDDFLESFYGLTVYFHKNREEGNKILNESSDGGNLISKNFLTSIEDFDNTLNN